jgi:hypothetical protein
MTNMFLINDNKFDNIIDRYNNIKYDILTREIIDINYN